MCYVVGECLWLWLWLRVRVRVVRRGEAWCGVLFLLLFLCWLVGRVCVVDRCSCGWCGAAVCFYVWVVLLVCLSLCVKFVSGALFCDGCVFVVGGVCRSVV